MYVDHDARLRHSTPAVEELRAHGVFITLEGGDSRYPLEIDSLQKSTQHRNDPRPKWLLVSVHPTTDDLPERAVVWVADDFRADFLQIFQDYLDKRSVRASPERWETPDGNPAHRGLVANIGRIRQAVFDDLWQSGGEPPRTGTHWWELWLTRTPNALSLLASFAANYGVRLHPRQVEFTDRVVTWAEGSWDRLQLLPFTSVPIAEIRRPEFIDTVVDLGPDEQSEYVQELAARLVPAPHGAPAVCHLDSGVNSAHVLLTRSLAATDVHDVIGEDGNDTRGHGTKMAGLALLGPLGDLLETAGEVVLGHRLESVRIMPRSGESLTDPLDYGTVTAQAVALPEATVRRPRVFCMPVSVATDVPGEPTLWSAMVDALAAGTDVVRSGESMRLLSAPDPAAARLLIVSAGNTDFDGDIAHADHLAESDLQVVDDPAQAWNVLVVGAFTNLTERPGHPQYDGWWTVAAEGQLSPHSRTSVMVPSGWPIRPDICMEGGNVLVNGAGLCDDKCATLNPLTTSHETDVALKTANATSAATAQASRLAAIAMSEYPEYWPETIRGLLVHAAEWTPAMRATVDAAKNKTEQAGLLRRYGWGVPDEDAVLRSSRQAVTLVTQDEFVPFEGPKYEMRRLRLHELPWPDEVLRELDDTMVTLRVTLSYFVEPSPAKRGWRSRYSYQSHGLRFEMPRPGETVDRMIARINRDSESTGNSNHWRVGPQQRNSGSLHQDIWEGKGRTLADCGTIAVFPVGGWWKRNNRKDRLDLPVRYSLLVSLRTPAQDIDLYTPIAAEITVPVETAIET